MIDPVLLTPLIFVGLFFIISSTLSILFMKRYLRYRNPDLFYWGLSAIILTISSGLQNFMTYAYTAFISHDSSYYPHNLTFLLGIYPLLLITLNKSIMNFLMKNEKKRKIVMILTIIFSTILSLSYYAVYIIGYHDNFSLLELYMPFYNIISSLFVAISLILFCWQSLKSDLPSVRLKGKFQLLAVLCLILYNVLFFVILELRFLANIPYSIGMIFLYIGIVLPETIKKIFIKGDNA